MSLFTSYDSEREAVLMPSHCVRPVPGFPDTVIITFLPRVMEHLSQQSWAEQIDVISAFNKYPIYRVTYQGRVFAVYQTLLGAAGSAAMLEEVLARGEVKQVLLFGSCGSLVGELSAGHLIVPTAAYRDEGVSYHYLPTEFGDYVPLPTAPRMEAVLAQLSLPFLTGKTWTTDALYRETRRNLAQRQAEGCVAVDMECAALAAVCRYRDVEFFQFLYTEDNLGGESWEPGLLGRLPETALDYFRVALEVAARL